MNLECSPNCAEKACEQFSGACPSCETGFFGADCKQRKLLAILHFQMV